MRKATQEGQEEEEGDDKKQKKPMDREEKMKEM